MRVPSEQNEFDTRSLNRRDLIKRSLQFGGAAYVAPMILAAATPASAQVSATCVGATCVNFIPCQGNPNCVCFSLQGGGGFCGVGVSCSGLAFCDANTPCAGGFVCQINTCCGAAGICVNANTACNIAGGIGGSRGPGSSVN